MQFQPYLNFDGTCAEAMNFYQRVLGGKLEQMMKVGDSPMCDQMPPGSADKIMHACLILDGSMLMASDHLMPTPYEGLKGMGITLNYPKVADAEKIFNALADGGKVGMPMAETFWVEKFGAVVDRFGTSWLINGGAMRAL